MTYIVPDSKVYILKGVPITNDYKNTLYFASRTAQYNYFYSKSTQATRYTELSYVRANNNTLKVNARAVDLYDANYLMFQNTSFGNKWFYAFVTNVEYINNETTQVTFEIDRVQTWWFDVELRPCMVIRQHAVNDGLYVNCEPESFSDFANYTHWESNLLDDEETASCYITLTTGHCQGDLSTGAWVDAVPRVIDGVYTALEISVWRNNSSAISRLSSYLNAIIGAGKEEAIIAIYVGPKVVGDLLTDTPAHGTRVFQKSTILANAFQGYSPRNNKIYNYPFCKLTLEKGGGLQEYAIEDFRNGITDQQINTVSFGYYAVASPGPQVIAYPIGYRGATEDYNDGMDIAEFPQVPVMGDAFQMWLVQNSGGYIANLLGALVNIGISSHNRADKVGSFIDIRQGVQQLANFAGQAWNASKAVNNVTGLGRPNILSNIGENTFWLKCKSLSYWQARQIDTYFDMFGYQENHVFTPNIHARQRWTYVQTGGCTIVGNAPADDIAFIENCFNKGITWWVNPSEVGNYNLSNPTL